MEEGRRQGRIPAGVPAAALRVFTCKDGVITVEGEREGLKIGPC